MIEREPEPEVCDARGRPLFGLKALQTSIDIDDMPEQPATPQLKDLVLRHEKKTRKLTDIFIMIFLIIFRIWYTQFDIFNVLLVIQVHTFLVIMIITKSQCLIFNDLRVLMV